MRRMFLLIGVIWLAACETELDAAYDEFRDQTPIVCKDYCEEKIACERPKGGGPLDTEVFAAQVHLCEVECATYAVEGAYIWSDDSSGMFDRMYDKHATGQEVLNAFECLYNMGAYRCVDTSNGLVHLLKPPTSTICEEATQCISPMKANYQYYWSVNPEGIGGSCSGSGSDSIEAIFF